jgi:hypothetical protein
MLGKGPRIVKVVAWAAKGAPAINNEATVANTAKRWKFFDREGEEATNKGNIVSLSSVFVTNLGFGERGLCEIHAKKRVKLIA